MTAASIDPYAVLRVSPNASQQQIRDAYLARMRRSHPDSCSVDDPIDTTVQQLVDAYDLLRDPARRSEYEPRAVLRSEPTPIPVRVVRHPSPSRPPIQAGPVRWHS